MTYSPGKFDSPRDAALHFLCSNDWSNDSTGDIPDYGLYAWRISNTWGEVKPENTEITSLLEDYLKTEDIQDSPEFRRSLVGHFLVTENSQGFVSVIKAPNETALLEQFSYFQQAYDAFFESQEQD